LNGDGFVVPHGHKVGERPPPEGESMRDREPPIRSRELGEGLRRAMFDAGLNGSEAARQLGWSSSRVSGCCPESEAAAH
jgi:hypothetical protein